LRHKIMLPKERVKMIERVTAHDIRRVARDIFRNKKLNLAVIGSHTSKASLSRILNLESLPRR